MHRIAFIISHPIQYYAPLYQRLARRKDICIKVFFTWHCGDREVEDHGFQRAVAWDIPLTEGYEFESVKNIAADPGTHHFFGLRNPTLIMRVLAWEPTIVHITGWAWWSNLVALHAFAKRRMKVLFRGDSHLLDDRSRSWIKRISLKSIYKWPTAFLYVGTANRVYYESFEVPARRLFSCPHSVDVSRFSSRGIEFERAAAQWRAELGIKEKSKVLLFAGKLEVKKRPLELMKAVKDLNDPNVVLLIVGNGELQMEVERLAASDPQRFRVLPFQNQSRMPVVYRLGDLFVLPSSHSETWGLGVNEAMASGRAVLVSDRVGCATDVVIPACGRVFSASSRVSLIESIAEMFQDRARLVEMGRRAGQHAWLFDIEVTESTLLGAVRQVGSL